MKSSTARFFAGLAIVLVVIAGVFTVYSALTEDRGKTTMASGNIKSIFSQKTETRQIEETLGYCDRAKLSQVKYNYDKVIIISNNPDENCEADEDQVIYNYNKATFV